MAKIILACFADSHLSPRIWSGRDIVGDSYYSLRQIVDFAVAYKVAAVVSAGDLLDAGVNRAGPIVTLNQQVDRLAAAGIRFLGIQGNHDEQDQPWLTSHPWPEHINNKTADVGGFKLFGLDFCRSPLFQIAAGAIPAGTDIAVLHQTLEDIAPGGALAQGGLRDIPNAHTVFVGDVHIRRKVTGRGLGGQKITAISPGSTCMASIAEETQKYFSIMDDTGTWSKVPLLTRRRLDFNLTAEDDIGAFARTFEVRLAEAELALQNADARIRKPLAWITYPYALADQCSRLTAIVKNRAHIFWRELPPEPAPEVAARRQAAGGRGKAATLLGELPGYLQAHELEYIQPDCVRLLESQNPLDELQRMSSENVRET